MGYGMNAIYGTSSYENGILSLFVVNQCFSLVTSSSVRIVACFLCESNVLGIEQLRNG
jgi:hypothetical protein